MIEFSIGMKYCLDRNRLDCVILHDESEEMDDMVFVPRRTCRMVKPDWGGPKCRDKVCSECGAPFQTWGEKYCSHCGAEVEN